MSTQGPGFAQHDSWNGLNVVPEPQYVINFQHLSLSFMIFQIKILSSSQPGGKFKTMRKSANKMIKQLNGLGTVTILLEQTNNANKNYKILLVKNRVRFAQHKLSFKEI